MNMPVELEIRDGDPWWLSPDIWAVPGDDPEGAPDSPVAGEPAFIWARVHNRGSSPVNDAEVKFYWADPSTGFDRNTAHYVGSSWVSLSGGETAEVLLLTPWIPEHVNDGHECLLAETGHPGLDPLPSSPVFNTPTDRHVAQRNLTVLQAAPDGFFRMSFSIFNTSRRAEDFLLKLEAGSVRDLSGLSISTKPPLNESALSSDLPDQLTLAEEPCLGPGELARKPQSERKVTIRAGASMRLSLAGLAGREAGLIHIRQIHRDRVVGGLSVLVRPAETSSKASRKPSRRTASDRRSTK